MESSVLNFVPIRQQQKHLSDDDDDEDEQMMTAAAKPFLSAADLEEQTRKDERILKLHNFKTITIPCDRLDVVLQRDKKVKLMTILLFFFTSQDRERERLRQERERRQQAAEQRRKERRDDSAGLEWTILLV